MSLGYSVALLRSVLRDIVFLSTKVVDVVCIIHEMKLIHLESMNFSQREIQNNRKYCTTGDPSYFTTGEIVNLTETGYFYGYC